MKPKIKKISLSELEEFVNSKRFSNLPTVPISKIRALSYLSNPHAKPTDIVLYMAFINSELVAFRTIFAGIAQTRNLQLRFGWCSGNWVHPDFRRQGLSMFLLNQAYLDWDKKLAFTNYAPNSEKLYIKTGWFKPIHKFEGVRAYLFVKTQKLLPFANKNHLSKIFFGFVDFCIVLAATINAWLFSAKTNKTLQFEQLDIPDDECFDLLEKINSNTVFHRNKKELKWIFNMPWLSTQKKDNAPKYPFSSYTKTFYYRCIKIYSNKEFQGFFVFSVREAHLKTLLFCEIEKYSKEVAVFLKEYCVQHQIEMITVYKNEIAIPFFEQKLPFLHRKKYGQKIYTTFEIKNTSANQYIDGDGDAFFT